MKIYSQPNCPLGFTFSDAFSTTVSLTAYINFIPISAHFFSAIGCMKVFPESAVPITLFSSPYESISSGCPYTLLKLNPVLKAK